MLCFLAPNSILLYEKLSSKKFVCIYKLWFLAGKFKFARESIDFVHKFGFLAEKLVIQMFSWICDLLSFFGAKTQDLNFTFFGSIFFSWNYKTLIFYDIVLQSKKSPIVIGKMHDFRYKSLALKQANHDKIANYDGNSSECKAKR